jgi:metal-responsive CopG/Arc/MetJ family transcriptional regulator
MKVFSFKVPKELKAELDQPTNTNPNITRSEAIRRAIWETIEYAKKHGRLPPIFQDNYDSGPFAITSVKIDDDLDRELSEVAFKLNTSRAEIVRRATIRYVMSRKRKTAVYVGRYVKIRYGLI